MINGNQFTILAGSTDSNRLKFAHSSNVTVDFDIEPITVVKSNTGSYDEYETGRKTMIINFEGLSDYGTITERNNFVTLEDYFRGKTAIHFQFGVDEYVGYNGTGFISRLSYGGESDGYGFYNGSLQVTGTLTKVEEFDEFFLLKEDGDFLLQENGDKIVILV